MKTLLRLLVLHLLAVVVTYGSESSARRARAELGPDIWARVLRIDNRSLHSPYPSTVYATVFEFAGILWFYTDTDGTQSFSLHRDRLAEEEADFGPLLRSIEPGFVAYEVLPDVPLRRAANARPLPNGCFIDSLSALRAAVARGERVTRASLLSYYSRSNGAGGGHTVLAYETAAGFFVVDSSVARAPLAVTRASLASDPRQVANLVAPAAVAQARWLAVPLDSARSAPEYMSVALTVADASRVTGAWPRL